jgi:hypothetical protein
MLEHPGEGSVLPVEILSKIGAVIDALEKLPEEKCNEQVKKIVWLVEAIASPSAAAVGPNEPKCRDLELVGSGGMGVVYKARQGGLNRTVALKMVLAGAGPEALARFRMEAQVLASLTHPNIVTIFEIGELDGLPFFLMEYLEGGTLQAKMKTTPLGAAEAARHVETLARAVHHAHQRGIVHCDLKPSNVLLTADGTLKITDFGLAKLINVHSGLTLAGAGTPNYMAPEQAAELKVRIGFGTDIHALGAILFEMLSGRPPFPGKGTEEVLKLVLEARPVLPAHVPPDIGAVCLKCLEKEPGHRYASAQELVDDLHRFLEGNPVLARPPDSAGGMTPPPFENVDHAPSPIGPPQKPGKQEGPGGVTTVTRQTGTPVRKKKGWPRDGFLPLATAVGRKGLVVAAILVLPCLVVAAIWIMSSILRNPPDDPGGPLKREDFVPLFNGRDLTGWRLEGPNTTKVDIIDGELLARNSGQPFYEDHLVTTRTDYLDFQLRFQVMLADGATTPPAVQVRVDAPPVTALPVLGASTVGLRAAPLAPGPLLATSVSFPGRIPATFGTMRGYLVAIVGAEVGVSGEQKGATFLNLKSRAREDLTLARWPNKGLKSDVWHGVEVKVTGSRIRVYINEKLALDFQDGGRTFRRGAVAFGFYPGSVTRYRNIVIRELTPEPGPKSPRDDRVRWEHRALTGNEYNERWGVFQHVQGKEWIESVTNHPKFQRFTFTEVDRTDEYVELARPQGQGQLVVRLKENQAVISGYPNFYTGKWKR